MTENATPLGILVGHKEDVVVIAVRESTEGASIVEIEFSPEDAVQIATNILSHVGAVTRGRQ